MRMSISCQQREFAYHILDDRIVPHIFPYGVRPMESARTLRRIAEIINLVPCFSESVHNIGIILVPPAACYVNLCHNDILFTEGPQEL